MRKRLPEICIVHLLRSVAVALLFSVLLGPLGLLYVSLPAAIGMMLVALFALRAKLTGLFLLVWVFSCVLSVFLCERHNRQILRHYGES